MAAAVSHLQRSHTIMPDMDSDKDHDDLQTACSPAPTDQHKETETDDDVEDQLHQELTSENEYEEKFHHKSEEEKQEPQSKERDKDTKDVDKGYENSCNVEDVKEEKESKEEIVQFDNEAEIVEVELEDDVNVEQEQSGIEESLEEKNSKKNVDEIVRPIDESQNEVEYIEKEDECLIIDENIEPENKSHATENVSSSPKPGRRKRLSNSIEFSTTPITRKRIKTSSYGNRKRVSEEVFVDGQSSEPSTSHMPPSGCGASGMQLPKLIVTNTAEDRSVEEIEMLMLDLREEIQALHHFAKQKEREWNKLIRLKKLKEELYLRLQRRIQMMENLGLAIPRLYYNTPAPRLKRGNSMSGGISVSPISIPPLTHSGGKYMSTVSGSVSSTQPVNNGNLSSVMPPLPQVILPQSTVQFLKPQQLPVMMFQPLNTALSSVSQSPSPTMPLTNSITTTSPSYRCFPEDPLHLTQIHKSSKRKQSLVPRDATFSSDILPIGTTTVTTSRIHRPILPKPSMHPSGAVPGQLKSVIGEGRQGPIVDVRSIIADYRSKHPEEVPRRGKRIRSALSGDKSSEEGGLSPKLNVTSGAGGVLSMSSIVHGSGSQVRTSMAGDVIEVGNLLGDGSRCVVSTVGQDSRPSSADSSRSGAQGVVTDTNISFKDVLLQFAKLSQSEHESSMEVPSSSVNKLSFPEVTLHPVNNGTVSPPISSSSSAASSSQSLLHGILTKPAISHKDLKSSTFSPTLARLLTAPERQVSAGSSQLSTLQAAAGLSLNDLLAVSKTQGEITITPVNTTQHVKPKEEVLVVEEDADDSGDRLVIDESAHPDDGGAESTCEDNPKEGLECQGCHEQIAQFVCAGCGNQWYCSRECQVSAWEEHCEVCSG